MLGLWLGESQVLLQAAAGQGFVMQVSAGGGRSGLGDEGLQVVSVQDFHI